MKIGTITFHASFNYGSMLQAYALHKALSDLGHDVEIINFQSFAQKQLYHYPIDFDVKGHSRIHLLFHYLKRLRYYINQVQKWNCYNKFLHKELALSKEFNTIEQLKNYNFNYECIFIGSDQIWNINCEDFSEAFFGTFIRKPIRKIAYAPSMGPSPELLDADRIKKMFKDFHAVSVRETRTKEFLISNSICSDVSIALDPTMLLRDSDYDSLSGNEPLIKGDYIFFYDPFVRPNNLKIALEIAKKLGCPVVIDRLYPKNSYSEYEKVKFITKVGPKEFLNLIKYSKMVIAHSLHGVIFSVLFKKNFYAIDGDKDSRISYILDRLGLEKRAINKDTHVLLEDNSIDYWDKVNDKYALLKNESLSFIRNALQ